jgi:hypothetical protein
VSLAPRGGEFPLHSPLGAPKRPLDSVKLMQCLDSVGLRTPPPISGWVCVIAGRCNQATGEGSKDHRPEA